MKLIIIIITLFLILYLGYLKIVKQPLIRKKNYEFSRRNLYKWMNLSKNERYNLSKNQSGIYFSKRKDLLDKIRKEYKTFKKNK
tara:strand:+ start:215 stop:466 length:252 start_codon:yes stop_codon:yes gene_type:complete